MAVARLCQRVSNGLLFAEQTPENVAKEPLQEINRKKPDHSKSPKGSKAIFGQAIQRWLLPRFVKTMKIRNKKLSNIF